jgi:hypothetical protein
VKTIRRCAIRIAGEKIIEKMGDCPSVPWQEKEIK